MYDLAIMHEWVEFAVRLVACNYCNCLDRLILLLYCA